MRWCRHLFAVLYLIASAAVARAEILIEAERGAGTPLRMVIDRGQERVLVIEGRERILVDLAAGHVYVSDGAGAAQRIHARYRPGHDEPAPYRIEPFGPGPVLAGHGSAYHVLFAGDRVCAELMLSPWMAPFVDPAVRALALSEPPAKAEGDPCAAIPFSTYAAAGWPLLAGKIDHPTFATKSIRFDYQPAPDELALPAPFGREDAAGAGKSGSRS